jgi:hypothetical protein
MHTAQITLACLISLRAEQCISCGSAKHTTYHRSLLHSHFPSFVFRTSGLFSSIPLGYELDDRRFESRQRLGIFSLSPRPDRLRDLPSLLSNGY